MSTRGGCTTKRGPRLVDLRLTGCQCRCLFTSFLEICLQPLDLLGARRVVLLQFLESTLLGLDLFLQRTDLLAVRFQQWVRCLS